MANKDQKRGNKELRKPKQAKSQSSTPVSQFIVTSGKTPDGKKK